MSQSDNISSQKTVSSASSTTIANLCDPFRLRSSPAGCSVIRRDRCSRSHQLLTQHLRVGLERQRPKNSHNSNCKLLRSISKLFLLQRHQVLKLQNYPITKLQNQTSIGSPAFSNGQAFPSKCSSNSFRNFFTKAMVGIAAASPNGQNVFPNMFSDR
jgi:hypothetical protein